MSFKKFENSVKKIKNDKEMVVDNKISHNNFHDEGLLEKKVICHNCNKAYPHKNEYCPFCFKWNFILKNEQKINKSKQKFIYASIFVIVIFFCVINNNAEKNRLIEIEVANKLNADAVRLETENKTLNDVRMLLNNKKNTDDDWKLIAEKLRSVSTDNPSFKEAQNLLPPVELKISEIEKKEEKELEAFKRKFNLFQKNAVALRWEKILEGEYGFALVRSIGESFEILQVSLIRIDRERINEILGLGIYNEAKNAKFKMIKFIDPDQRGSFIILD